MNILFLDQYGDVGGAQACLLDLIPAVRGRGWIAHAAVPRRGPLGDRLRAQGVTVHTIPCGPYRSGAKGLADLPRFAVDVMQQRQVIQNLLREIAFDLVYVNGARLLPAASLAIPQHIPMVFHVHWRYAGTAARMTRWSIRRSHPSVIGCCGYVMQGLRVENLHVIPNGVADCGFREPAPGIQREFRIGIIGRIAPEKGQLEFLQAAALLAPRFPNVRFVICGAALFGGEDYEREVRERAVGLPVDFLGWRDDIPSVLRTLDLLVIASREEGLPRVLLEAFSAGVPVAAFPAGGIPEALIDGQTGFLIADSRAETLAARIEALLTGDPARLRETACHARRTWEREYDVAHYRRNVTNLLARLVPAAP